jgi:hypothetical protein
MNVESRRSASRHASAVPWAWALGAFGVADVAARIYVPNSASLLGLRSPRLAGEISLLVVQLLMPAVRAVYAVSSAVGAEREAALRDALVAARVISSDYYRAHALAAVAALLPETERKTVLRNAGCGLALARRPGPEAIRRSSISHPRTVCQSSTLPAGKSCGQTSCMWLKNLISSSRLAL